MIRSHIVRFLENEKGGDVDLNLEVKTSNNTVPERRPVGRPRKVLFEFEPNAEERKSTPRVEEEVESQADYEPSSQEQENEETQSYEAPRTRSKSGAAPAREHPPTTQGEEEQPGGQQSAPGIGRFRGVFIPKRKRTEEEPSIEEPVPKVPRSLFTLISQSPIECYKQLEVQVFHAFAAELRRIIGTEILIPGSYAEVVGDPHFGELWQRAIQDELTTLAGNGTWEEVVPPKGVNIVTSKWVFKPKLNTDGSLKKAKARLVIRGFTQRFGHDFWDTFAPTVRYKTLRMFLAIVALLDLELYQVDINNAFTESRLREDIYIAPPEGVTVAPGRVFKLLRSLYGLKQAARD